MDMMMESTNIDATIACEIARLPEDLISALIARTGPRSACRAAVVLPAFQTVADSDAVWKCFLPSNLPTLAKGALPPQPLSKKALFMRLSDGPVLLADGLTSMWLDKETGAMCYMLSAKKLSIDWSNTPTNYRWIPITSSRIFSDAAKVWRGHRLEIYGKIDSNVLSKNTTYTAYIVLGVEDGCLCFGSCQKTHVTVRFGRSTSTRDVLLDSHYLVNLNSWRMKRGGISNIGVPRFSNQRTDGWMELELELGDFHNGEGEDGEVSISLVDTSIRSISLIVLGIQIIAKEGLRILR